MHCLAIRFPNKGKRFWKELSILREKQKNNARKDKTDKREAKVNVRKDKIDMKEAKLMKVYKADMRKTIALELMKLSDEKYRKFSEALIPGETNMLGVRIPELRKLAKKYAGEDFFEYLKEESVYFEEKMLKGLIIGYATEKDKDVTRGLMLLDEFVGQIDNWSVCDSFCNTFKVVRNDLESSWKHIQRYVNSGEEFKVRVGLILILNHFIKCDSDGKRIQRKRSIDIHMLKEESESKGLFEDRILEMLNRSYTEGYYAMMAAAWTIAEMFVTYPSGTYILLKGNNIDDVTQNKAIQKICESLTPTREVKHNISELKRNKQTSKENNK